MQSHRDGVIAIVDIVTTTQPRDSPGIALIPKSADVACTNIDDVGVRYIGVLDEFNSTTRGNLPLVKRQFGHCDLTRRDYVGTPPATQISVVVVDVNHIRCRQVLVLPSEVMCIASFRVEMDLRAGVARIGMVRTNHRL